MLFFYFLVWECIGDADFLTDISLFRSSFFMMMFFSVLIHFIGNWQLELEVVEWLEEKEESLVLVVLSLSVMWNILLDLVLCISVAPLFVFVLNVSCSVRDSLKLLRLLSRNRNCTFHVDQGFHFLDLLRSRLRQFLYLISVVIFLLRVYCSLRNVLWSRLLYLFSFFNCICS